MQVIVSFISILVTEVFSVAIVITLARCFYLKIAVAGGAIWKNFLRIIYLIAWVLPTAGIYLVINFGIKVLQVSESLVGIFEIPYLSLIYPFNFGLLVAKFINLQFNITKDLSIVIASIIYCVISLKLVKWTSYSIRSLAVQGKVFTLQRFVGEAKIKIREEWLGIMLKDLRVVMRSPAYASFFMLPLLQTMIIMFSMLRIGEIGIFTSLNMLLVLSPLIAFLPPILFSIERIGQIYIKTLPIKKSVLLISKTLLLLVAYFISIIILSFAQLIFGGNILFFLEISILQSLSIISASMIQHLIMFRMPEGYLLTGTNVYTRIISFITVVLPGALIVMLPLVFAYIAIFLSNKVLLSLFPVVCITEFVFSLLVIKLALK